MYFTREKRNNISQYAVMHINTTSTRKRRIPTSVSPFRCTSEDIPFGTDLNRSHCSQILGGKWQQLTWNQHLGVKRILLLMWVFSGLARSGALSCARGGVWLLGVGGLGGIGYNGAASRNCFLFLCTRFSIFILFFLVLIVCRKNTTGESKLLWVWDVRGEALLLHLVWSRCCAGPGPLSWTRRCNGPCSRSHARLCPSVLYWLHLQSWVQKVEKCVTLCIINVWYLTQSTNYLRMPQLNTEISYISHLQQLPEEYLSLHIPSELFIHFNHQPHFAAWGWWFKAKTSILVNHSQEKQKQ